MKKSVYDLFPELLHQIGYPAGETLESIYDYLKSFVLDGSSGNELENYLKEDLKRFIYTLSLLPDTRSTASLLEIGANPYFTSILLKRFTSYRLFFTNYFGVDAKHGSQVQRNRHTQEALEFKYKNVNIEIQDIPFEEKFDVILLCEVLEHLQNDPVQAILKIKSALSQNGALILTTPNVSRLENISKMICGANIYDPYSGYGPYGRHNREYNKHELFLLLNHCGFEVESMFSSDVHENHSDNYFPVEKFAQNLNNVKGRSLDLGQYIFLRARNVRSANTCKPRWLFRSYPDDQMCAE